MKNLVYLYNRDNKKVTPIPSTKEIVFLQYILLPFSIFTEAHIHLSHTRAPNVYFCMCVKTQIYTCTQVI